ncbi:MAG: hypothetical protein H6574_06390 [Lewinellaceae bacterium]|nr:hypothetical protein [Lewinellaceae bacterium]
MIKSLSFLLIFLPVVCLAQPEYTTSPTVETESKGIINVLGLLRTGENNNVLAVYRSSERGEWMKMRYLKWAADVFDSDMEKVNGNVLKEIKLPNKKDPNADVAINFGGKPWLILLQFQKRPKRIVLYRCPIDPDGAIGTPEEFGSCPIEKEGYRMQEYGLLVAPDASKLLFVYYPSPDSFKDPISFAVFDNNWNQQQSGFFNLPKLGSDLRVDHAFFAPNGTIYMPAWTALGQNRGILQELWVWQDPTSEPKRIDVKLDPDKLITNMKISHGPDGNLYVGGVWSQASKYNLRMVPVEAMQDVQGHFFLKIDPTTYTILSKNTATFSDAIFSFWKISPSEVTEKGRGVKRLYIEETRALPDGSFWFTMEQFSSQPLGLSDKPDHLDFPNPVSGPVIIIKYGPDGALQVETLVKRQIMSVKGSGNGHLLFPYADNALLLYNVHKDDISDEPENYGLLRYCRVADIEGIPKWQQEANSAVFNLTSRNSGTTKALFNFEEKEYWFDPSAWLQVSPTSLLVGCDGRNGNYGLIRVDWPE